MKIRRVLEDFIQHLERRLRKGDYKTGWCHDTREGLIEKIQNKVVMLEEEISEKNNDFDLFGGGDNRQNVADTAADVANLAMMINHNWGIE